MLGIGAAITVFGTLTIVLITRDSPIPRGSTRETEYFTGLTLVASVGILMFAIAAAIYTKPAYEQWKESQTPIHLSLRQLRIRDFCGVDALWANSSAELPIEPILVPRNDGEIFTRITVNTIFHNGGSRPTKYLTNFFVPMPCELETMEAPAVNHVVSATTKVSAFTDNHEARFSWIEDTVFDDATMSLAAGVLIPNEAPNWVIERGSWPMCVVVRYERNKLVIRWDLSFADGSDSTLWIDESQPVGSPEQGLQEPDHTLGEGQQATVE